MSEILGKYLLKDGLTLYNDQFDSDIKVSNQIFIRLPLWQFQKKKNNF